jgi:hypothetical protein
MTTRFHPKRLGASSIMRTVVRAAPDFEVEACLPALKLAGRPHAVDNRAVVERVQVGAHRRAA